jgi:hypothetical protein
MEIPVLMGSPEVDEEHTVEWLSLKENSLVHESSPPLQHNVPT